MPDGVVARLRPFYITRKAACYGRLASLSSPMLHSLLVKTGSSPVSYQAASTGKVCEECNDEKRTYL
jgi:hypothetical protein